jgi:general secretion pathway protein M
MNVAARRALSAFGALAAIALALAAAASTALALRQTQGEVALLRAQAQALEARAQRASPRRAADPNASPFFRASSITQAGAALQQRMEAAIAAAHGRLISSKVEVASGADRSRISLTAEMTLAAGDMQALLFDLETGRPYLFVNAFEARAQEGAATGALRVSLAVSGQWSPRP